MTRKPVRILIFGSGGAAAGATIGWRLSQHAHVQVTVVCRSNYDVVKASGFRMRTSTWGDGFFHPYRTVERVGDVGDVQFDYVICANKVTQSSEHSLIQFIQPVVGPEAVLVTVQNGISVEPSLRRAFHNNAIVSAVCYISCTQESPGSIQQLSQLRPNAFHIGFYDDQSATVGQSKLEHFAALDSQFKLVEDMQLERWTKMVFNGSWNPVAALFGLDTYQLLENPVGIGMVRDLADEIYQVAIRTGIPLPPEIPARTIQLAREIPVFAPSMLQDARRERPMEIEALCGSIWRLADNVGIRVPTVKFVYKILMKMNASFVSRSPSTAQDQQSLLRLLPVLTAMSTSVVKV